ncbi:hypothetical protein CR513_24138, partial [Mucuna pruriens]
MQDSTICWRWRCGIIFRMICSSMIEPILKEVRDGRRRHIDTWLDLMKELRTRFVLASYA